MEEEFKNICKVVQDFSVCGFGYRVSRCGGETNWRVQVNSGLSISITSMQRRPSQDHSNWIVIFLTKMETCPRGCVAGSSILNLTFQKICMPRRVWICS